MKTSDFRFDVIKNTINQCLPSIIPNKEIYAVDISRELYEKLFPGDETNLFNIENVLDSEEIDVNEFETLGFGKYKKKDIRWVEENDPEYLVWLICSSVANKQKITLSDDWIRYILVKLVIPSIIDGHYLNERVSGSVKPKRWNRKESKSIKEVEEKPVVKTSKKRKTDFDYDHQPIHYDNEENLAEDIFGLLGF